MTTFTSLKLSAQLLKTLAIQGYETPTPIQAQAIPPVLDGRDLLGSAQTGTGKTAAFLLPIIQRLMDGRSGGKHRRRPRALILAPTRELAAQIEESLRTYGRDTGLRQTVLYGGVTQMRQVRQLEAGVDIIVATPGRLIDLMEQGYVDLHAIEIFVLDEADRMLDMGFIEPIRRIAGKLPRERQTLLFSATMPPRIRQLACSILRDPVSVSVMPEASAVPLIDQELYHVPDRHKSALLTHLLKDVRIVRTVVFTKTKYGAERLAARLARVGVTVATIHGNKSQSQRDRSLSAFRSGRSRVLIATDVAARGLDVDGISHVINFNLPNEPEAYIHRIGRTGRAGATGQAISFCSPDERGHLRAIERLTGQRIETTKVPENLEVQLDEPTMLRDRSEAPAPRQARVPRRKTGSHQGSANQSDGRRTGSRAGAARASKRSRR